MTTDLSEADNRYFHDMLISNQHWLNRVGPLDFSGKRVLDIGCGHGALVVNAMEWGAESAVGVDTDERRIEFARKKLGQEYTKYEDSTDFFTETVDTLDDCFGMIVCKDSFEHIDDLSGTMEAVWRLLAPGGVFAVGFSPLYSSPRGDHGRLIAPFTWSHAVLPEQYLVERFNRKTNQSISSASDLGLNKLTPMGFRSLMDRYPWEKVRIRYNQGTNPLLKLFSGLRFLSEKYFTVSIYATAYKPKDRTVPKQESV